MALILALPSCTESNGREFARYYDPSGFFTASLPAANTLTVTSPQSGPDGPGLLAGVIAQPPAPSPAPQTSFFDFSGTEEADQTIYQVLVVTTSAFEDLGDMGLFFLTGDPGIDVQLDETVRIDGWNGRLLVVDVQNADVLTASVAVGMTLGEGGTGYLVAAVFPPGEWAAERSDFFRVLESFRGGVPPGFETFPVSEQAS